MSCSGGWWWSTNAVGAVSYDEGIKSGWIKAPLSQLLLIKYRVETGKQRPVLSEHCERRASLYILSDLGCAIAFAIS